MLVRVCDVCGEKIPVVKRQLFGREVSVLDRGKVESKEANVMQLFDNYDICKTCAEHLSTLLDYTFVKMKIDYGMYDIV